MVDKIIVILRAVYYGLRLGRDLKKEKIDIIIFNLPKSGIVTLICSIICNAKRVFYCHGVQYISDITVWYKFLLKMSDHIVAVSKGTLQQLNQVGISKEKCTVIYNSFEPDDQRLLDRSSIREMMNWPKEAFIVGCLGNIIKRKGIDILVKAFYIFSNMVNGAPTRLIVIGNDPNEDDGKYRQDINAFILKNNLSDTVQFLPYKQDARRLLEAFDIFVMPSRMESFGVAIIEAMAAKIPVIATKSGSIPEIVKDGVYGILVPPEDTESLAKAMYDLYTKPQLRKELAEASSGYVRENFTLEKQASQFIRVLLNITKTNDLT